MSTSISPVSIKRRYREGQKCPLCRNGLVKLYKRREGGRSFWGCSSHYRSGCKFNASVAEQLGYVYVATNPGYQKDGRPLVKIGYTTRPIETALKNLEVTGVPFPFEVKYREKVWKAWATMRQAHISLRSWRLNPDDLSRDFFFCSVEEAIEALKEAIRGDVSYKQERPTELVTAPPQLQTAIKPLDIEARAAEQEQWRARQRVPGAGYVYVLVNDVYRYRGQALLKIGYTSHEPQKRARELFCYQGQDFRGVPQEFQAVLWEPFEQAFDAEGAIHEALAAFRVNPDREFFSCSLAKATEAIRAELGRGVAQRGAPPDLQMDVVYQNPQSIHLRFPAGDAAPVLRPMRPSQPRVFLPERPSAPIPFHRVPDRRQSHSRYWKALFFLLLGGVIAMGVGYLFALVLNWWRQPSHPDSMPPIQTTASTPQMKKAHGHSRHKKHKTTKQPRSAENVAEPEHQNERLSPMDPEQQRRDIEPDQSNMVE